MSRSREISFSTEAFKKMERLRLLKVYWSYGFDNYMGKESQKLLLPKDFEFPSHNLRYLHWEGYSLKSLPANFDGGNLIELNLKHSNIEQLWQGEKDLEQLKILTLSKSQQLKEIPDFSNMLNLEQLNIDHCGSLDKVDSSIGFLKKLTFLNVSGCTKIRSLPSTIQYLASLESLYLDGTAIQDLPFSIHHLTRLHLLSTEDCKNLRSLPSNICKLKSLEYLYHSGCSNLETFPEIMEDMECMCWLDLSGTGIKELPSTIEYLNHLKCLCLEECKNLRSLPTSIFRLKSLEYLILNGCSNLETFQEITEDMEFLKNPYLRGTGIKELSSLVEYLNHLTSLVLEECKNLRSLWISTCSSKSLKNLFLNGCSNFETFLETFLEIMEDMEFLKNPYLRGTGIKELSSLVEYHNHLTSLVLEERKNLRSLQISTCKLKFLNVCSNFETFPKIMEDMEFLKNPHLRGTGIKELPSSIGYLNYLTCLRLKNCKNLRSLPSSIFRLKSLIELNLSGCPNIVTGDMENLRNLGLSETQNLMNGEIPSDLWCLSSLVELDLSNNNMHHIPTAITQLCNLERLNISLCKMLEEIPGLPSSLREIHAYGCTSLGTFSNPSSHLWSSLLKWFKKVEPPLNWKSIHLGSNGIPGWVSHQEMGSQIRIELPMNWYRDDQFLGFGFFCLHQPDMDSNSPLESDDSELSDEVWVAYYPKISIPDKFHSNQYIHLQGSFDIPFSSCWRNIKSCGIHLIYSQDLQQNHILLDDEHNHMPMPSNLPENSGDNRLIAKHDRLRESFNFYFGGKLITTTIHNYYSLCSRVHQQNFLYIQPSLS